MPSNNVDPVIGVVERHYNALPANLQTGDPTEVAAMIRLAVNTELKSQKQDSVVSETIEGHVRRIQARHQEQQLRARAASSLFADGRTLPPPAPSAGTRPAADQRAVSQLGQRSRGR